MFGDAELELDLARNPTARVGALTERKVDEHPNCLSGEQLAQLLGAVRSGCLTAGAGEGIRTLDVNPWQVSIAL